MDANTVSELTELSNNAKNLMKALYDEVEKIVRGDLPTIFSEDVFQTRLAISACYFHRGYVMSEALNSAYLLPADKVNNAIGAYIHL